MTKQEETASRLSEKISKSLLEPVLVVNDTGDEFDVEKWLSYCKQGILEVVSSRYISPAELIGEYENHNRDQQIPDTDN